MDVSSEEKRYNCDFAMKTLRAPKVPIALVQTAETLVRRCASLFLLLRFASIKGWTLLPFQESLHHFINKQFPQKKNPTRRLNPNNQAFVFLDAICLN
jgi:hypothetical protein